MSASRPVVVHPDTDAPELAGMERRRFHAPDGRWMGWSGWIRNDAGDMSGWHHHAANDTHVYVSRGSITIEFGPGGGERFVARAGDFFIIPAETIHRETTSPDADVEAFIVRIGGEPEKVDVEGPCATGS